MAETAPVAVAAWPKMAAEAWMAGVVGQAQQEWVEMVMVEVSHVHIQARNQAAS